MFRKVSGCFLSLCGTVFAGAIVFLAFNGKYGTRQFISDISQGNGNFGILSFSVIGLAVLMLGLWLMFSGKQSESSTDSENDSKSNSKGDSGHS